MSEANDGGPLHPTTVPVSDPEIIAGFSKIDEFAARALQAMIPFTVTVVEVKDEGGNVVSTELKFPDSATKNDFAMEALQWGAAMMRAKGVLGL